MTIPDHARPDHAREIRLASRPKGMPTRENFDLTDAPVPEPGEGQLLVRNSVMSVDPYMRGRMNDVKSYVPPFALGKPLSGGAVGEVVASHAPDVPVGTHVLHQLGWREYSVLDAAHAQVVDVDAAPPSAYLGVLGMPGMTAWVGLVEIAGMREGDIVFVSGAAGAVGSLVGQYAALRGAARVVGSAGSGTKVATLTDRLGFDAAFDYHEGPVAEQLAAAAPKGIDVYFDNVGGEHLEAAIGALRPFGRVAACGAISAYNATEPPPGPRNLMQVVGKRLTIQGFIVSDHEALREQFLTEVGGWLRDGKLVTEETVREGLDAAPDAFIGLLQGDNTGKMLVRL